MKNILLVGASRSGKTTLAKIISNKYNMTHIPFDAVVSTLENVYPETGIKHEDDNTDMSKQIATFVQEFIKHLEYEDIHYIIELYQLYPHDIDFIDQEKWIILYLGYPSISKREKLRQIKEHAREKDWTRHTTDEEMIHIIGLFRKENRIMYQECLEKGYPFFDTSKEFDRVINICIEYIDRNIQ